MLSVRFRIAARLFAVVALAGLTAGCFQPMYAEHADGTPGLREKLMGVEIPPIDKPNASPEARVGVAIRNALAFKLYGSATGVPPTHRLVIRFTDTRSSLLVDVNTGLPTTETVGIDARTGDQGDMFRLHAERREYVAILRTLNQRDGAAAVQPTPEHHAAAPAQ